MSGEPTITIVGTVGGEPELRFISSGTAVSSLSVAVNRRKKQQDGSWADDGTNWYRVTVWNQMAENVAESIKKGDRVQVTGRLWQRQYESRDGGVGYSLDLQADMIGPDLRFHQAQTRRVDRNGGGYDQGGGRSSQQQRNRGPEDDPWGSAPPPPAGQRSSGQQRSFDGGFQDEPPF